MSAQYRSLHLHWLSRVFQLFQFVKIILNSNFVNKNIFCFTQLNVICWLTNTSAASPIPLIKLFHRTGARMKNPNRRILHIWLWTRDDSFQKQQIIGSSSSCLGYHVLVAVMLITSLFIYLHAAPSKVKHLWRQILYYLILSTLFSIFLLFYIFFVKTLKYLSQCFWFCFCFWCLQLLIFFHILWIINSKPFSHIWFSRLGRYMLYSHTQPYMYVCTTMVLLLPAVYWYIYW